MQFFKELLAQFSQAENLAGMVAEHLLGILIIVTPLVLAYFWNRRRLQKGVMRGSLSGDLFFPLKKKDGSTQFTIRTILMANLADMFPDKGLLHHLFGAFAQLERSTSPVCIKGQSFNLRVVQLANKNAYWGVTAVLVKHLSAMMGETFIEMAAKGGKAGLDETAETDFVMALLFSQAGTNWFPRLVLVEKSFLFSLVKKKESDFSFALPPHTSELATLQSLAQLYKVCEGDQLRMAEHGLVMANVSLPTEEY